HRDCDPQHAAGRARLRLHRVHVSGRADRGRHDEQNVHLASRPTHARLYYRPVRLTQRPRTNAMANDHTTKAFDGDLQEISRLVAEMGGLAERQIADSVDALSKRDAERGQRVIAVDLSIDALQREIEEKAVLTIARRQPMAVDLREIVGAL